MNNKVEKYITEGTQENTVARMMQKQFGVKVKGVDVKRKIVFQLAKGIDENDFDKFDLIDDIISFLKKKFKGSTVKHDFDRIVVEEL